VAHNFFIPISLGNPYYSKPVLNLIVEQFIAQGRSSIIIICDRLRYLSYRIRGATDEHKIKANIFAQVEELKAALNTAGLEKYPTTTVATWAYVEQDNRFCDLLSSLHGFLISDPALKRLLSVYARDMIAKFRGELGGGEDTTFMNFQRQYLLEEIALALYMIEVRGFETEVYKERGGMIDDLYELRATELTRFLNKPRLQRKFIALKS
jgi:tRNA-dependent cyclodipeptide synthase